jgi:RNA polymerase sigma-70 factor, ECF subfamily
VLDEAGRCVKPTAGPTNRQSRSACVPGHSDFENRGPRRRRPTCVDPDEEDLVARIATGDEAAFEAFYRRTAPWLTVRLRRRCADDQIVAEVLQETYVAVWRAAGEFAGVVVGGSAAGWLWTIAARRLVDAFRRRARYAAPPLAAATPVAAPPADEAALAGVVGGDLGGALDRLAPELRQVLQATVLDGLSVRETAALLGVPEGTVKTRARRARIVLREALS